MNMHLPVVTEKHGELTLEDIDWCMSSMGGISEKTLREHYFLGYSLVEIAKKEGVCRETVYARLRKAKRKLRYYLDRIVAKPEPKIVVELPNRKDVEMRCRKMNHLHPLYTQRQWVHCITVNHPKTPTRLELYEYEDGSGYAINLDTHQQTPWMRSYKTVINEIQELSKSHNIPPPSITRYRYVFKRCYERTLQ